jgi:hypothetical protein
MGVLALGNKYFYDIDSAACDLGERGYNGGNYSTQSCNDKPGVRLIVGQDTLMGTSTVVLQATANSPTKPTGGTITINGIDLCDGDSGPNNRDRKMYGYYENNALGGGVAVTRYQIGGHVVNGVNRNKVANCGRPLTTSTSDDYTISLTSADYAALPGVPGVWTVAITVSHIDNAASKSDGIKNGFTLTTTGGLTISTKAGGGGLCGSTDGKCTTLQTAQGGSSDGADYATYFFRFGSDCTVPAAGLLTSVSFFDLDFGSGDTVIKLTMYDATAGKWLWPGNPSNDWRTTRPSYDESMQPPRKDRATSNWYFTALPRHKYILYVENVGPHLVMQAGTPFDGAFYTATCPAPAPPTCSLTVTPGDVDPFTPVTLGASYTTASAATVNLTFKDANGVAQTNSQSVSAGGAPVSFTFNPPPGGFAIGNATATGSITNSDGSGSCPLTVPVLPEPYLAAYGADVVAGAYATDSGSCVTSPADIVSWNHDAATPAFSAGDYAGAGGKAGVFATGNIGHFSSGLNITNLKPTGLSFANTATSGTTYGGQFGNALPKSCDFSGGKDSTATYTSPHEIDGDVPLIPQHNLVNNKDEYILVENADVYINANVVYFNSDNLLWGTSLSNIPSFKLVVKGGNIYISGANVGRLDGLYVATPKSDGTKGEIFTCAEKDGSGNYIQVNNTLSSYKGKCDKQLKIYGSFVAKKIHFDRTAGTVGQARSSDDFTSDNAAEEFIFSPEMWLPNGSGGGSDNNKAYQGLPPVL